MTPATTGFTAIVSRIGCSSGVQGEPAIPEIEYTDTELRISPHIDNGTCEERRESRSMSNSPNPLGAAHFSTVSATPAATPGPPPTV